MPAWSKLKGLIASYMWTGIDVGYIFMPCDGNLMMVQDACMFMLCA